MDRVQWIEHNGKKILYLNYTGLRAKNPEEKKVVLAIIKEATAIAAASRERILFLSDVTNTVSDTDVVDALREFGHFTSSHGKVEKECVVGVTGLQKALVSMLNLMSKTKLVIFDTLEQAKDYLTQ
jgi:hypothetical protein